MNEFKNVLFSEKVAKIIYFVGMAIFATIILALLFGCATEREMSERSMESFECAIIIADKIECKR